MNDMLRYLKGLNRKPRLHPNGFIQLDLKSDSSVRLHIWPSSLPKAQKTNHPIHDHVFDMSSTVLQGELQNINYTFTPVKEKVLFKTEYKLFQALPIGKTKNTKLVPSPMPSGILKETRNGYVCSGEEYKIPKGVLHLSVPVTSLVATVMLKENIDKGSPYVAIPVGVEPDNDFKRESVPLDILWKEIAIMTDLCFKRFKLFSTYL